MPIVTTRSGLVRLFAAKLGVGPRPPRKMIRAIKRTRKHAAYRANERHQVQSALGPNAHG